jgi:hypothetical protein
MVFLPECFDYVSESQQQAVEQSETIDGAIITQYRDLAQRLGVWLSLGGFHQRVRRLSGAVSVVHCGNYFIVVLTSIFSTLGGFHQRVRRLSGAVSLVHCSIDQYFHPLTLT